MIAGTMTHEVFNSGLNNTCVDTLSPARLSTETID